MSATSPPEASTGNRATAEAFYDQAVDSLASNNLPSAIAQFREALAADPTFSDATHGLIHALKNAGQLDEAVEITQALIVRAPDDILANTSLSILYQHQGKIPEAEAAATRAKLLGWKQQLQQHKEPEGLG